MILRTAIRSQNLRLTIKRLGDAKMIHFDSLQRVDAFFK